MNSAWRVGTFWPADVALTKKRGSTKSAGRPRPYLPERQGHTRKKKKKKNIGAIIKKEKGFTVGDSFFPSFYARRAPSAPPRDQIPRWSHSGASRPSDGRGPFSFFFPSKNGARVVQDKKWMRLLVESDFATCLQKSQRSGTTRPRRCCRCAHRCAGSTREMIQVTDCRDRIGTRIVET